MLEKFYNIDSVPLQAPDSRVSKLGATQFLTLGNDNRYFLNVRELEKNVPVLRSLVEGSALLSASLFQAPDDLKFDFDKLFQYLYLYGQVPVLVRKSRDGRSSYLTPLDSRFIRTNEDLSEFAYSEQDSFHKKLIYPKYSPTVEGSSIIYIRLNDLEAPYALPIWSSAVREVQILAKVSEYHNASLDNGFGGSFLINMNNGEPSPEDKRQIEELVNRKFAGSSNAGRIMLSFNDSKEQEATVQSLSTDDTSARYMDLMKECRQALFTSFRASSQLLGCPAGDESELTSTDYPYRMGLFIRFTLAPICKKVYESLKGFGITMKEPMSILDELVEKSEGNE